MGSLITLRLAGYFGHTLQLDNTLQLILLFLLCHYSSCWLMYTSKLSLLNIVIEF